MSTRIELQTRLEAIQGNRNVYYQTPDNLTMEYPCIRYSKSNIDSKFANNGKYINKNRYEIIVINKRPDSDVIQEILKMPLSSYDRHYTSNGFNHDVIILYY